MIESDTIKLLREDDSGVDMGVLAIEDVLDYVTSQKLKDLLIRSKDEHMRLKEKIGKMLQAYEDEGKKANPIIKGMSKVKTNMNLLINESDHTVASIITDGCNMGVKSLNMYLNEYEAASEEAKDITKKLIKLEEALSDEVKEYL